MIKCFVPQMLPGRVAWKLIKGFLIFYPCPILVLDCPSFCSRKGDSTIIFSSVLLRLLNLLIIFSEKLSQIIINLKTFEEERGRLIHVLTNSSLLKFSLISNSCCSGLPYDRWFLCPWQCLRQAYVIFKSLQSTEEKKAD